MSEPAMIYLHKFLPFFVLPLGITFVLTLAGVVLRRRFLCWLAMACLWIAAMPVTGDVAIRAAEGWEVRRPAGEMPQADAIVVLSGGLSLAPGDPPVSEWINVNRFLGGIELYRAGKAPLLVFTGGWLPWRPLEEPEGRVMIPYAADMGIPADHMLTTDKVANTAEEAAAVAALLGSMLRDRKQPRVLLVTSAYHMRRSLLLFRRHDLHVVPYPVDFQVSQGKERTFLDYLPRAEGLRQTERALREFYGFWYYRLAGS